MHTAQHHVVWMCVRVFSVWANSSRFFDLLDHEDVLLPLNDVKTIAIRGGHTVGKEEKRLRDIVFEVSDGGAKATGSCSSAAKTSKVIFTSKDSVRWLRRLRPYFSVPTVFHHLFGSPILSVTMPPAGPNKEGGGSASKRGWLSQSQSQSQSNSQSKSQAKSQANSPPQSQSQSGLPFHQHQV